MAIYVEKKYQKSSLPAIVEDSLESGSHENAPSINAVKKAIPNPNLLINSDFRNPINQRGKTSYWKPSSYAYNIDRWTHIWNSVILNSGYIRIYNDTGETGTTYFKQIFEHPLEQNDYAVTVNVKEITGTVQVNGFGTLSKGLNVFTVKNTSLSQLQLNLVGESSIELYYIKLEKGDTATPFNPRLYAEELALCKRFYQKIPTEYLGLIMSMGSQTYRILSNYQGFRTNPTVKWINGTQIAVFNRTDKGNGFNITITNFTYNQEGMLIIVGTNGTNETIAPGIVGIALLSNAAVELDAEIY